MEPSKFDIIVPDFELARDEKGKAFTVYNVKVQAGDKIWTLQKRYTSFYELYTGLQIAFPSVQFPPFPPRLLFHKPEDIEERRKMLEHFVQEIGKVPKIASSFVLRYFLQYYSKMGNQVSSGKQEKKKILMPLPDKDFDPTESSVPWKLLMEFGHEVFFATEIGDVAQCDQICLKFAAILFSYSSLGADPVTKTYYAEMENSANFKNPIRWEDINVNEFDGIILVGGNAPGMKAYLESEVLQSKLGEYWNLKKPLGAIHSGVLLLARSKDKETGKSLLYKSTTTALGKPFEAVAYYATRFQYGNLFKTYDIYCEDEVKSLLENPEQQYERGPFDKSLGVKGTVFDDTSAFVCKDKVNPNYISARWPGKFEVKKSFNEVGDAFSFTKKFCKLLDPSITF